MTLLAALAAGAAAYAIAGAALGRPVRLRLPRRTAETSRGQQWLLQAGVSITPRQFWAGSITLGAATFMLVVLATATPAVALMPAIGVAFLPRLVFARRRLRRMRAVQEAWPDGLREITAAITAGRSLRQAMGALASAGPQPLQQAFNRFPALSRVVGVTAALEVIREELADPTSDRVIEVLTLAHERGGRLVADVLRDLADATTEDLETLEEISTASLEQKINGRAVFALPWIVLLFLCAAPGHFRDFYQSAAGTLVVAVAAVLSLGGMLLLGRLGRDPVEPRVLGGAATRTEARP